MNFQDAFSQLKEGKYLAREAWESSGEFCVLLPSMPFIWKIVYMPNHSCGNWLPMVADLDAQDWLVKDAAYLPAPAPVEAQEENKA